ncbi:choline/ethanolamine kinase [Nematocida minor]|uniref:choline/ethanolamine kinase n=1 Tax=Nematocida minor TaxID=1912983 RepID=UPI00221F63D3|nr:choline/ethanolamine kinase [Nematocida minor]KAI5189913.1 choline/ethanolamine kinase [Nematocida minor]
MKEGGDSIIIKKMKIAGAKGKAKRAIKAVAHYLGCSESELSAERQGLGYSNIVFKVSSENNSYLYKEYLSDITLDSFELKWQKHFERPKVLFETSKYRIDEYIEHRVMTKSSLKNPEVLKGIAKQLSAMHSTKTPPGANVYYANLLKDQKNKVASKISSIRFFEICKKIEKKIETLCSNSIFKNSLKVCHNDLQFGNILLLPTNEVVIIDFEHVSLNIPSIDIAGFFNEACTNYRQRGAPLAEKHFLHTEYAKIFLKAYLKEQGISAPVNKVLKEIEKVRSVSHYYWFVWAIAMLVKEKKQASLDYFAFAMNRLRYLQQDDFITSTNVKELRRFIANRK